MSELDRQMPLAHSVCTRENILAHLHIQNFVLVVCQLWPAPHQNLRPRARARTCNRAYVHDT
eukprot:6181949-Pleurochrysis_carterae.AAC.3